MRSRDFLNVAAATVIITLMLVACGAETAPDIAASPDSIASQVIAEFLSIPATDVRLVSITAEEFNDSSLDCPEPGMSYLQVLTPGHRVIVEADGRRFDVRVSGAHGRICHRSKVKPPASGTRPPPEVSELINLARQDLARHLAAESPDIQVLEIHPLSAQTVVTGCSPECDDSSTRCGYMIGFTHDGRRYDYHVDQDKVTPCPPILKM